MSIHSSARQPVHAVVLILLLVATVSTAAAARPDAIHKQVDRRVTAGHDRNLGQRA